MNSSKWTLSILLATCCIIPTVAQAETLHRTSPDAKGLAKYEAKYKKASQKQRKPTLRRSKGSLQQKESSLAAANEEKLAGLREVLERQVAQAQSTQQNAVKPRPLSEMEYQEAEIKLQQLQNAWDPESFEPFPTFENHPELLQGVYDRQHNASQAQQQPAGNPQAQAQQPQPCNCEVCREPSEADWYRAEEELQLLRDTTDPAATFKKYPQLLPNKCNCQVQTQPEQEPATTTQKKCLCTKPQPKVAK